MAQDRKYNMVQLKKVGSFSGRDIVHPSQDEVSLNFENSNMPKQNLIQISVQKKTFVKIVIGSAILFFLVLLLFYNSNDKNKDIPKSRFPSTHEFHPVQFKDDGHLPSPQHSHYPPLNFTYPTVGIPVPGNYFNSTRVPNEHLKMFDQAILDMFKPYNDTDCKFVRYGDEADGGYVICENFIDQAQALLNLGIHGFDNFGCDLTSVHRMPNYQFDCTDQHHPICSTNQNNNKYTDVCLGDISEKKNLQYWSLEDVMKKKNLTNKKINLKIDIDGGEYLALRYLPVEYLDNIVQIYMEAHFDFLGPEQWGFLDIFRTIADKFVNVNYNNNNNGCFKFYRPFIPDRKLLSHAIELTLVNKKHIKLYSQSRSWVRHPLNALNVPTLDDCQHSD